MVNKEEDSVSLNFKDIFLIFIIYFLSLIILSIIGSITHFLAKLFFIYASLGIGIVSIIWLKAVKKTWLSTIGFVQCELKYYFYAIVCGVLLFFLSKILLKVALLNYDRPVLENISLTFWILNVDVFTPISEEIYFRGILFSVFRKKTGLILGVILSALIFSLVHFNFRHTDYWHLLLLNHFIGGIVFIFLYHFSKSLFPSITSHIIANLLVSVTTFINFR